MGLADLATLTGLDGASPASTAVPVTVLAAGDTFACAKGTVRRYAAPLVDPASGLAESGFSGSEALRCVVWEGGDGPAVATPAASWASTSPAFVYLDVGPSDLAGLDVQPYPVRVEVNLGGQWQQGWDGWVDVLYEAATAATLPTYGSYQDLLRFGGPSIRELLTADSRAGFLRERADGRRYLDQCILARYRPPWGRWGGMQY